MPDQEDQQRSDLVAFKDWLEKQPHLPHDVEDSLLVRFLSSCKYSVERAKRTIDLFFTIRSTAPEMFCKRDPCSPEIQRVFEITDLLPLPNKTKENYRLFIYRLNNPDMDLFNFVDAVKTFFMLADTRLTEEEDLASGEIPIFDSANVSLKFIGKVNLSVLRKYMLYTQEAMPIRLKQVHIINAPSYIGKIYALCKPFLKKEVAKLSQHTNRRFDNLLSFLAAIKDGGSVIYVREDKKWLKVKFHEPNSTSLYEDVPQELLPAEYGGEAGSIEQIKRHWIKRIEAKRDWFLANDERWSVAEALRPLQSRDERADHIKELPGSFRTLALD